MVRKRQQRRRRRRIRSRRVNRRNMSSAIPRQLITSNTRNIIISYTKTIDTNGLREDVTIKNIFDYPPNKGLRFQYREAKVLSVRIYWQSDSSTSDTGSVCLNVEDYGENSGSNDCDFNELLSYPGSMVRKVWQNVSNRWFPTEPSDREFHGVTDDAGVFTYTVRHSVKDAKLKGRIVALISIRMRGKSTSRSIDEMIQKEYLDSTTKDLDMVVIHDEPATSRT